MKNPLPLTIAFLLIISPGCTTFLSSMSGYQRPDPNFSMFEQQQIQLNSMLSSGDISREKHAELSHKLQSDYRDYAISQNRERQNRFQQELNRQQAERERQEALRAYHQKQFYNSFDPPSFTACSERNPQDCYTVKQRSLTVGQMHQINESKQYLEGY